MDLILYDKSYRCLTCQQEFTNKKVRTSKVRVLHHDNDLRSVFADINPYFYESNVCPFCGFAFTESFSPIESARRESILADYTLRYLGQGVPNLCHERDISEAVFAFKLALGAGFVKEEPPHLLGGISLRIAWLYRDLGDAEEIEFLSAANRFYRVAYENQRDTQSDAQFLHLLGATSLRLGQVDEARRWFGQLFTPRYSNYAYRKLAREAWDSRKD